MGMAERKPKSRLPGGGTDHRPRIREAGSAAHPRHRLDRLTQREQRPRGGQQPIELRWRRRRVARGKLGTGGQPQPLLHRGDAIADIGIHHRTRQSAVAARTEMPVIAALDGERHAQAERAENIGRPWAEREHSDRGVDRTFGRFDPPLRTVAVKRAGVALEHEPAQRRKTRRIGLGQCERIGDARGFAPEDAVTKSRRERRLELTRAIEVEHLMRQSEPHRQLALGRGVGEACIAAIDLEPAGLAQVAPGPRFRDQRLMLGQRAGEQGPHCVGKRHPACRRGLRPVCHEPGRDPWQKSNMIVRLGGALERDPQQRR